MTTSKTTQSSDMDINPYVELMVGVLINCTILLCRELRGIEGLEIQWKLFHVGKNDGDLGWE